MSESRSRDRSVPRMEDKDAESEVMFTPAPSIAGAVAGEDPSVADVPMVAPDPAPAAPVSEPTRDEVIAQALDSCAAILARLKADYGADVARIVGERALRLMRAG